MTDDHAHHWMIDFPEGPTSEGACGCGEVKTFINSSPIARQDVQRGDLPGDVSLVQMKHKIALGNRTPVEW